MTKLTLSVFIELLLAVMIGFTYSPLEEGERLLQANKPMEARPMLEAALNGEPENEKIYLYLGIVYEQLGQSQKSISIMQRGVEIAKDLKDSLYFNIGNNFYKQGEKTLAEEMYTRAIKQNSSFPEPYLNRANTRLAAEKYREALNDYVIFLRLKPNTEQRPQIEKMIQLLGSFLDKEEREEREKIAREKALMNQVLNSLKNASEDTQNLSIGSEGVLEEEEGEIDIEE